ncbi:MAG TPA: adenylate/guanylate cyclase domain-containing protein [Leptolyngbyaceae cyanobacterium M65_K2018_010]|nr:adenylate/guanylate cyclase domain-containing protein [Leptolyngbyaceae cyanobacterium M65_K2018_010]
MRSVSPFLPSDPLQESRRLPLPVLLNQVVSQEAHRHELKLAYVRAIVLLISLGLDVAVFLFPQPLIGQAQVPPTVMIISLCASLFALGLIRMLQRAPTPVSLGLGQCAIPVFDSLLLWAFITNIWRVLGASQPLIISNIAAFCCLLAVSGGMRLTRRASLLTTALALANFLYAARLFGLNLAIALFAAFTILGTGFVGMGMATIVRRHVKNEAGRVVMERFLPRPVVEAAFEAPLDLLQQPQRCEVTVVVTDLRDFTQFAEDQDPQAVMDFLNRYQGWLAGLVEQHGGWVDKFMGDGMLAVFGAPEPLDDHAERALAAAIAMDQAIHQISPLAMGIGLHSGPVVAGCLGTGGHLEFTVIGDTVNVAARIEAMTKQHPHALLLSQATAQRLPGKPLKSLGEHPIRGRLETVELFTLSRPGRAV